MMKSIAWSSLLILFIGLLSMSSMDRPRELHADGDPYHSTVFRSAYGGLPDTTNSLFTGSGKCAGCHAADPNHFSSIAGQSFPAIPMPDGWDVNVTDDWRSSLMANSAKDPFWRAKVRHEVLVNPEHQLDLEDKCTSCHAPLGHFAAHNDGASHYAMSALFQDSLALDGVSCVACHQQSPEVGNLFSGELLFDDSISYGPYGLGKEEPVLYDLPMITYTGYMPMYGEHVVNGEVCAGCHSLITHTTDLEGNYTGDDYVEQATYHEWLNSVYADDGEEPTTCNGCHLPRIEDPVIISSGYAFLEPRTPYGLHTLVGGNAQMLEIMRDNIELLGLNASAEQFDSTLQRTRDLLRYKTLDLEVDGSWIDAWGGSVSVKLTNRAGHKFPSGYPARRAWIELVASVEGEEIWQSGGWSEENGSIIGVDEVGLASFEPHHDIISQENQVQIYELVAADITGSPTNILERAATSLKDNRLTPRGFSYDHSVYDTTRVEGLALVDPAFDVEAGSHVTHYEIPISASGSVDVQVRVWYQSMPPRWVNPMFAFEDSTIQAFQILFESQGAAPELVADTTIVIGVIGSVADASASIDRWAIYPNPTQDGHCAMRIPSNAVGCLWELYAPDGSRIASGRASMGGSIDLPAAKGMYLLQWHPENGVAVTRRIIRR
jgi:hypothetical protein